MTKLKPILLNFTILFIISVHAFAQETGKRSGYFNNTKLGVISVLSEEYGGIVLSTVNGWHFTENLSAGIGISVQVTAMPQFSTLYLHMPPTFLRSRSRLLTFTEIWVTHIALRGLYAVTFLIGSFEKSGTRSFFFMA